MLNHQKFQKDVLARPLHPPHQKMGILISCSRGKTTISHHQPHSKSELLHRNTKPNLNVEHVMATKRKRALQKPQRASEPTWNLPRETLRATIGYNKYGAYCVPIASSHRPAAHRILAGDVYEPDTINYMIANARNGDIIHAGAYFGDFLPALAHSTRGTVWAFEPNRQNFRCAEISILLNDLSNVRLFNAGLGARSGTAKLQVAASDGSCLGGASHVVEGPAGEHLPGVETVSLVTIDDVVPPDRKVSILQLDVEHYEKAALSGAMRTVRACLPILILESEVEHAWFSEHVLKLGYVERGSLHGNKVFGCD